MEDYNFSTQVYLLDPRGPAEIRAMVERALKGQFRLINAPPELPVYQSHILGLVFYLRCIGEGDEGRVYRLTGSTDDLLLSEAGIEINLDRYISKLLTNHGVARLMTNQEFVEMNKTGLLKAHAESGEEMTK